MRILLTVLAASIGLFLLARTRSSSTVKTGNEGDTFYRNLRANTVDYHQLFTPKFAAGQDDDDGVLNVHVVPHTHDDVGWLKTVEQYYYGRNNTIQRAAVKYILSTVMEALVENPNRTFTYVEQKFFSMWWDEQSEVSKRRVKHLIANDQLSFVNGGWCMHDEATTHYVGMIDQTTLGHDFLQRELGVIPTVGWQLDPFGHSATQASLLTENLGFDALYFGRIDYQDLKLRHESQECEGLWNSSPDNLNTSVFWGLTGSYSGNYGPPNGFCFDVNCQDEPLVGDDDDHLLERVGDFVNALKLQSDRTKGRHIMLTMGEDFNFEEALVNFANLDLLISSIYRYQSSGKIDVPSLFGHRFKYLNVFYSSPEYYTFWKHKETKSESNSAIAWSTKTDDFFPYSDCPHCFWTGYFTSRTGFKRLERVGSSFLQVARQIETIVYKDCIGCTDECCGTDPMFPLDDAMGIVQHHDAVSGTAKQHVADDYARRVQEGINHVAKSLSSRMRRILLGDSETEQYLEDLSFCQFLNETRCDVSTQAYGKDLYVVVYNGLAKHRSAVVGLPVPANLTERIRCQQVSVQLVGTEENFEASVHVQGESTVLYFNTGVLPPVGASVFKVSFSDKARTSSNGFDEPSAAFESRSQRQLSTSISFHGDSADISNGILSVRFDRSTGFLQHISNEHDGSSLSVLQELGYYTSFNSAIHESTDNATQNSSAYIFRPYQPTQRPITVHPVAGRASFVETATGVVVEAKFEESWVKQSTRVFVNQPYVEIEYTIGPIPIDDGEGKEFVTKICSPIKSGGVFFTDSNGREFMKRKRGYRPSWTLAEYEWVAGNYYPVNAAIFIEDDQASLAVVLDRSQGASSLENGCIEIMIQRRTLVDDARGVGEAMNETTGGMSPYPPYGCAQRIGDGIIIKTKQRIMVGKGNAGASLARSQMDEAFLEPFVFVASAPKDAVIPFERTSFSALQASLPDHVMLVTFKMLHHVPNTTFLIRLGHQYATNESPSLSETASVDMEQLLAGWSVTSITEKTLSANQDYSEWQKRRLRWTSSENKTDRVVRAGTGNYIIELKPMEIRTFEVGVKRKVDMQ